MTSHWIHRDVRAVERALERLELACRERGLPVTVQRRAVVEALAPREAQGMVGSLLAVHEAFGPGENR